MLHDDVRDLREQRINERGYAVPENFQGVTPARIRNVLTNLDLATEDIIGVVFALLDDETPCWITGAPPDMRFCEGANTAALACHVGILQRGGGKLDREGRDYWIKPLREIGAIEPVYLDKESNSFLPGHPTAKSPRSAYRLSESFKDILLASENEWQSKLETWATAEKTRERLSYQARVAEAAAKGVDRKHLNLIHAARDYYAPRFLPGFEVLYIDDADGDRISPQEEESLRRAGLSLTLSDAMPDILLWDPESDSLWVIEAVTSDGEVDHHKVTALSEYARRHKKSSIGFTTAYWSWKAAAARQDKHKNLASNTYIWVYSDPARHYKASEFPDADSIPLSS